MLKKALHLFTTLLLITGILAAATPALALTGKRVARGRVVAINLRTQVMTLKTGARSRVQLQLSDTTRVWHKRALVGLSGLHVGNVVSVKYTPSATSALSSASSPLGTAEDVNDNNGQAEIQGTITAVDTTLNTVSIASSEGGSTVVLNVDTTTVIKRNGAPATLADLVFGDKVEAKYDSATMLASSINAEDGASESEVEGSITAIDAVAGTITISGEGDSSGGDSNSQDESMVPTDVTLNVTTTTVVMFDDSPASITDLQVGMQVEAQYDPATMNASFVEAEGE